LQQVIAKEVVPRVRWMVDTKPPKKKERKKERLEHTSFIMGLSCPYLSCMLAEK
jgi:hypothetical protein